MGGLRVSAILLTVGLLAFNDRLIRTDAQQGQSTCTYIWTLTSDFHASGASQQTYATTETDCRSACIDRNTCEGVDWNRVYNTCWFILSTTNPQIYPQPGINHWNLNSSQCPVPDSESCTNVWTSTSNVHYYGASEETSITSETDCLSACINSTGCVGFDWNTIDLTCWMEPDTAVDTSPYPQLSINHWQLEINCPAVDPGFCTYVWMWLTDQHILGGIEQTLISDQADCLAGCINNTDCVGVDWDALGLTCWFQLTTTNPKTSFQPAINHWTLTRNFCPADPGDCTYTWILTNNTHDSSGSLVSSVTTEADCLTSCIDSNTCPAVDWNTQSRTCWFQLNAAPQPIYTISGINHWDLSRDCSSLTTATTTITPAPTTPAPTTPASTTPAPATLAPATLAPATSSSVTPSSSTTTSSPAASTPGSNTSSPAISVACPPAGYIWINLTSASSSSGVPFTQYQTLDDCVNACLNDVEDCIVAEVSAVSNDVQCSLFTSQDGTVPTIYPNPAVNTYIIVRCS